MSSLHLPLSHRQHFSTISETLEHLLMFLDSKEMGHLALVLAQMGFTYCSHLNFTSFLTWVKSVFYSGPTLKKHAI